MLLSRSYSIYRESCSTPFFSHSYEFCVCKLFRFTYFPKTMHLCQNNGFQFLQNHILMHDVSATPLESHTSKIRGVGGWGDNPARIVILSERLPRGTRGSESKHPSATSSEYGAILRTETEPWIVEKSFAWPCAPSGATNC